MAHLVLPSLETAALPTESRIQTLMPLSRTAEAAWKLTDVRGYELHAEFIQAIKAKSPRLCETYGLCEDYDLADALIGVYHQYLRDKQRLPMARAIAGRERSIQKIYETGSLGQATSGAIVELKVFGLFWKSSG